MVRPSALSAAAVHICVDPVDVRKSFNGLSSIVEEGLELNPFELSLFVFGNHARDKVKISYWKNVFCLWYKHLEKDSFKCPKN
jgi:transposase